MPEWFASSWLTKPRSCEISEGTFQQFMDSGFLFLFRWQPDQILSSQLHANPVHPPPNLSGLTYYGIAA
ncbi:hypothetical protein CHARACLAT_021185 [Characodon lateralis]|uniref:Uncharacterized protein n=1 Tax=Characodon lateralis TaxID=208331 RepID=A0ABU7DSY9_9TELE|nr:hypothetical protein [Characodon lateralis]